MSTREERLQIFWSSYLRELGEASLLDSKLPEAWGFGDSPEMAEELGQLVFDGLKTATCSLLWDYETDDEPLPKVGELNIITDGQDRPLCIIEITEVQIKAYDEVDEQFAYDEGEDDRSLAYWRQAHWQFFSRACQGLGRQLEESVPLVCERFKVVFRRERPDDLLSNSAQ